MTWSFDALIAGAQILDLQYATNATKEHQMVRRGITAFEYSFLFC